MRKIVLGILLLLGSLGADMIAVAGESEGMDAKISSEAARAAFYILLNEQGEIRETIQNPYTNVKGGASAKAVALFKEYQVNRLIAGEVGAKMESALKAANISYTLQKGNVQNVIDSFKK